MKRVFIIIILLLALCGVVSGCGQAPLGTQLLSNGGLESDSEGNISDWRFEMWDTANAARLSASDAGRSGGCASIDSMTQNKALLSQKVKVKKGGIYRLSGYIRVDRTITSAKSDYTGAQLAVKEYRYVSQESYKQAGGWTYFELYFESTDYSSVTIEARIGSDSRDSKGAASFDDLSLARVSASDVVAGTEIIKITKEGSGNAGGTVLAWIAGIAFAALMALCFLYFCGKIKKGWKPDLKFWLIVLFGTALLVRVLVAFLVRGHKYDMSCFSAWSVQLANNGPWNFYLLNGDPSQINGINDYVPGYMYVLWLLGGFRSLTGVAYNSNFFYGVLKLPAILCDLACAWLIFKTARRFWKDVPSLIIASLFLFNPFVITNSAAWGQIESVTTLFNILTIYLVLKKKFYLSGLAFTGGVLFKFQTVFLFPVYLAYLIYEAVRHRELRKKLPLYLLSYLAVFYLACLPFCVKQIASGNVLFPFRLYLNQIDRYNEFTLNAFNIYGIFGLNRVVIESKALVGFLNYGLLALFSAGAVFLFIKSKNKNNLYLTAALLITAVCLFSVKVHERYLYPAIALMLLAFTLCRDKRLLGIFAGFSLLHYLNTVAILLRDAGSFTNFEFVFEAGSILSVLLFGYFVYVAMSIVFQKKRAAVFPPGSMIMPDQSRVSSISAEEITGGENPPEKEESPKDSAESETGPVSKTTPYQIVTRELKSNPDLAKRRLSKKDWIIMAVLTVIAAILAFSYLGGFTVPETYWETNRLGGDSDYVIYEKKAEEQIDTVWIYSGIPKNDAGNKISVSVGNSISTADRNWESIATLYATPGGVQEGESTVWNGSMYKWNKAKARRFSDQNFQYIRLSAGSDGARILEVVFLNDKGERIQALDAVAGSRDLAEYKNITDEQEKFTGKNSLMTDMYFDEIYHARTAYELLRGWKIYEWTHPPLGKELMAVGIAVFGMNPVGWRVISALFSVALIPIAYLLAKRLFRSTGFAGLLAGFFLFDGLRLAQGRMGTLDAISVFFILLSFFFMLLFYEGNFNRKKGLFRHLTYFALAGIVFGISISVKWTGVYAGIGLLVIFILYLFKRCREYVVAKDNTDHPKNGAMFQEVAAGFRKNLLITLGAGVAFFLLVPATIYILSYLPTFKGGFSYLPNDGSIGFFEHFWENQRQMLSYHGNLKATHACESLWITWPLDMKGVFLYMADSAGTYARIQTMGTPVLYWMSFLALIYYLYYVISRQVMIRQGKMDASDKLYRSNMRILGILFIGLLSNLLPWVFITRSTFFYHFFPSTFFYFGFLALFLRQVFLEEKKRLFDIKLGKCGTLTVTTGKLTLAIAAFLVFLNFWLFYPLFTGIPVSTGAANGLFRWIQYFGMHYGI